MRKKLNRIGIISMAKFQAFLMALVGLLVGILYSLGGLLIDALVSLNFIISNETPGLSYGTILAFGALIGMPIIFAIVGFITGIIEAALYNFYVKFFDGIDIDLS